MKELTFDECTAKLDALKALPEYRTVLEKDMRTKWRPLFFSLRSKNFSYNEIYRGIKYKLDQELYKNQ